MKIHGIGTFEIVIKEIRRIIDEGYYEDAIPKLTQCLQIESQPGRRADILKARETGGQIFILELIETVTTSATSSTRKTSIFRK